MVSTAVGHCQSKQTTKSKREQCSYQDKFKTIVRRVGRVKLIQQTWLKGNQQYSLPTCCIKSFCDNDDNKKVAACVRFPVDYFKLKRQDTYSCTDACFLTFG